MPKISVYQCPFTGEIVHGKQAYTTHLQETRKMLRDGREDKRAATRWADSLLQAREAVEDLSMLAKWFIESQADLYPTIGRDCAGFGQSTDKPVVVKLEFHNFTFQECTRNSHSCPRGGQENFIQSEDKPKGYPGFRGRLEIWVVAKDFGYWLSDSLKAGCIWTGSGGGGGAPQGKTGLKVLNFGYETTLWLNDWLGLGQEMSMAKLSGTKLPPLDGEFYVPEYFS